MREGGWGRIGSVRGFKIIKVYYMYEMLIKFISLYK